MLKRTAVLLLALSLFAACSDSDDGDESRPGNADVYARIEAMTDCGELQDEFDTAMNNAERYEAGSEQRDAPMAYAEAAQDRIDELDCP